jgi:adenylate cyclase
VSLFLVGKLLGKHVWAERYDRVLSDIFAMQDEITNAVAIAVAPAIASAERQRAVRRAPGRLDAWGAYQRGLWRLSRASPDDNTMAHECFSEAIRSDPNFAGGYIGLAVAVWQEAILLQRRSLADALPEALELARRAVELDEGDADAHACLSVGLTHIADPEGALAEAEKALSLSPNLANAHRALGTALIFSGRAPEGLKAMATAARLDPREPTWACPIGRQNQPTLTLKTEGQLQWPTVQTTP